MRSYLILILLGAFGLQGVSQIVYVSVKDYASGIYDVFKLNLSDSTFSLECDDSEYGPYFAIRPVTSEFIRLHTTTGIYNIEMNYCNFAKWGNLINPVQKLLHYGIDSDRFGFIWGIGADGIYKINPPSTYFELKGGPLDPQVISKLSQHNAYLGFGEYYTFGTEKLPTTHDQLIAIDTADPRKWRVVFEFPKEIIIEDIIELHRSCGDQSIICVTTTDEYYELNISQKVFKYLCKIDFIDPRYYRTGTSSPREIYGSSPWLFDPAECDVFIDLDIDNSSGNLQNGFDSTPLCSKSSFFISDNDPDVFSDYGTMDSVSIALLNPIDGNSEQISLIESFGVVSRLSPFALMLLPSSLTTNDSFALAIRSVLYKNLMCQPSPASRFFRIVVYKNGLSDTAYSTLHLNGPFYNAGTDATLKLCMNDPAVNLKDYLGSCSSDSGIWIGPSFIVDSFNPSFNLPGLYTYIVGDSICGFDSAMIDISVLSSPVFQFPNDTSICFNHFLTLQFQLSDVHYFWSDGDTSSVKSFSSPGTFSLTAFHDSGCSHSDTFTLSLLPIPRIRKDTFICIDQTFNYKGRFYKPGDLIRDTLPALSSCDSLIEWSVLGIPLPTPHISGDTIICQNDSSLLFVNPSFNKYSWSNSSQLPQTFVRSGTYALTVTDFNGCSGETSITIRNVQPLVYTIQVQNPRCSGDYGSIQILPVSGGAPSFFYDLNGLQNSNGTFNQLLPGKYFLQITDSEGCSVLDSAMIHNGQELLVEMNQSIELLLNQSGSISFNTIKGKVSDIWSNPPTDILLKSGNTFDIKSSIDQILTVIFSDENGCTYSLPLHVKIIRNQNIFFPNAFSPNGDQVNDLWVPFLGSDFHVLLFSVFDRWGNLIYQSNSSASWDGKTNHGQLSPPGVYLFQLIIDSPNRGRLTHSASITLFR